MGSRRRSAVVMGGASRSRQGRPLGLDSRSMSPPFDNHAHGHDDDPDHHHASELSEMQLRVRALESILTEKGYVDPRALDAIIEAFESKIGPHIGAQIVARAWADPDFKQRL